MWSLGSWDMESATSPGMGPEAIRALALSGGLGSFQNRPAQVCRVLLHLGTRAHEHRKSTDYTEDQITGKGNCCCVAKHRLSEATVEIHPQVARQGCPYHFLASKLPGECCFLRRARERRLRNNSCTDFAVLGTRDARSSNPRAVSRSESQP